METNIPANTGSEVKMLEPAHRNFWLKIIFVVVILVIGFAIGLFYGRLNTNNNSGTVSNLSGSPSGQNSNANLLSNPSTILSSAVFVDWSGAVEGRVVSRDNNSFTLERNGSRLQIYLKDKLTNFFNEASVGTQPVKLNFDQVNVGSYLKGAVTVYRAPTNGQYVFGNGFTVANQ